MQQAKQLRPADGAPRQNQSALKNSCEQRITPQPCHPERNPAGCPGLAVVGGATGLAGCPRSRRRCETWEITVFRRVAHPYCSTQTGCTDSGPFSENNLHPASANSPLSSSFFFFNRQGLVSTFSSGCCFVCASSAIFSLCSAISVKNEDRPSLEFSSCPKSFCSSPSDFISSSRVYSI